MNARATAGRTEFFGEDGVGDGISLSEVGEGDAEGFMDGGGLEGVFCRTFFEEGGEEGGEMGWNARWGGVGAECVVMLTFMGVGEEGVGFRNSAKCFCIPAFIRVVEERETAIGFFNIV